MRFAHPECYGGRRGVVLVAWLAPRFRESHQIPPLTRWTRTANGGGLKVFVQHDFKEAS